MKVCPQCQNTYTDDNLQFCLQDGTPLIANNAGTNNWTESETLVSSKTRKQQVNTQDWQTSELTGVSTPPVKSNTFRIVILTVLATLFFFGLVGFGTWVLLHNMNREVANTNARLNNLQTPPPNNNRTSNQTTNINPPANTNVNVNKTVTPTPKPTLKPDETAKIKEDVSNIIGSWKDASENLDINSHLSYYADTVDYYKAGKVGIDKVRADKQRAFGVYDSINIDIDNMKITVDDSGEKAAAVFDKEWNFTGEEKSNSGKVQQEIQLAKIGGKWRITGEKDLRIYYVNK